MSHDAQAPAVSAGSPGPDACLELHNGRFADVQAGAYFEQGTRVYLRGDRIEAVLAPAQQSGAPSPTRQLDLQGRTVIPALFNTHCHLSTIPPLGSGTGHFVQHLRHAGAQRRRTMHECLAHGITNLRDSHAEDLRPARRLKERIAAGSLQGPRIRQAVAVGPPGSYLVPRSSALSRFGSRLVGMPLVHHGSADAGVVEFSAEASDQEVRDAVNRAIDERGAESIKLGDLSSGIPGLMPRPTRMTQAQMSAAADQARSRGYKTQIHQVSVDTFRRAVTAGVTSLAHLARDGELSDADIDGFVAAGCSIEPTVSVAYDLAWPIEGDANGDDPDMCRLTEFREQQAPFEQIAREFCVPALHPGMADTHSRLRRGRFTVGGFGNMTRTMRYYASCATQAVRNARRLYARGVHMSAGNDGGVPPCTPAMMGHELALLDLFLNAAPEPLGFDGAAALRMATLRSAEAMGLEDRFGSLEPGKIADLVVLDGDPLQNPRLLGGRVAALFMDGRPVIDECGLR